MTKHLPEEERRRQILEAARECFIERGFNLTRMDEIARHAGLSKGGLYFHFKSKRDLFVALVEAEYETSMGFFEAIKASPQSPKEKLASLASFFVTFFTANPEYPRFFVVIGEQILRDETIREFALRLQLNYVEVLSGIVQEGIDNGTFRAEVDPKMIAELMKMLTDGVEIRVSLGDVPAAESIIKSATDLIFNGLLTDK